MQKFVCETARFGKTEHFASRRKRFAERKSLAKDWENRKKTKYGKRFHRKINACLLKSE